MPCLSEKRVALLLGNNQYQYLNSLEKAEADVTELESKLRAIGFIVHGGEKGGLNLTKQQLASLLNAFALDLRGASIGLFFFAGHGAQVNGLNLLLPTDATTDPKQAQSGALLLDEVANLLGQSPVAVRIMILDACRNNGLKYELLSGKGLSSVDAMKWPNTVVVFSTAAGQVASDGAIRAKHSPFAQALINNIDQPGANIAAMLQGVFAEVYQTTSGEQLPFLSTSMIEPITLVPPGLPGTSDQASTKTAHRLWQGITTSQNDRPEQIRRIQAFLRTFPNSEFSAEAGRKLRTLISEEIVQKATAKEFTRSIDILWVDDDNLNLAEKTTMKSLGASRGMDVRFTDAKSTREAMAILDHQKFDAIISDAGRTEEDEEVKGYSNQAGYRLLGKVRQKDIRTPFLIYSTSNDYKYKAEIYTKFGQGSTNDPIELFSLVLSHLPSN